MHLFIDILRNSILITGLVAVMMMMIESLNIESKGMFFSGLRKTKVGQVVIAALLGSVPGCMGGFATVSLYTHRMFSFGALVAMMIASSGDEAFMMLAMIPDKALAIFAALFVIAVLVGIITDTVNDRIHGKKCPMTDHSGCGVTTGCKDGYMVHDTEAHEQKNDSECTSKHTRRRHFGWKRIIMFIGLAVFIAALATGKLSHDHNSHAGEGHQTCLHAENAGTHCEDACCSGLHVHSHNHESAGSHEAGLKIDLLSEDWMNMLFAGLSVIVLFVLALASDHFVEEHIWNHIVKKHIPTIFSWTFGVLLIIGIGLQYLDISSWISGNTALMILLATAAFTLSSIEPFP